MQVLFSVWVQVPPPLFEKKYFKTKIIGKREDCANRLHASAIKKTVRRVCTMTGRARGVVCKEKVSRLVFKRLIEKGLVSGIKKI